jgi:hypothetical protein
MITSLTRWLSLGDVDDTEGDQFLGLGYASEATVGQELEASPPVVGSRMLVGYLTTILREAISRRSSSTRSEVQLRAEDKPTKDDHLCPNLYAESIQFTPGHCDYTGNPTIVVDNSAPQLAVLYDTSAP